jgi:hypothetical protein
MKKTTIGVTEATKKRINRIAAEKNLTMEEVVQMALDALEVSMYGSGDSK